MDEIANPVAVTRKQEQDEFAAILAQEKFERILLKQRTAIRHDTIAIRRKYDCEAKAAFKELIIEKREATKELVAEMDDFYASMFDNYQVLRNQSTVLPEFLPEELRAIESVVGTKVSPHLSHCLHYSSGFHSLPVRTTALPEALSLSGKRALHFMDCSRLFRPGDVIFGSLDEMRNEFGPSFRSLLAICNAEETTRMWCYTLNHQGTTWLYAGVDDRSGKWKGLFSDWKLLPYLNPFSGSEIMHRLGLRGKAAIRIACDMVSQSCDERCFTYINEFKLQALEFYPHVSVDPLLAAQRIQSVAREFVLPERRVA